MTYTVILKVTPWKEYKVGNDNLITAITQRHDEVEKCLGEIRMFLLNYPGFIYIPRENNHFASFETDLTENEVNMLIECPAIQDIILISELVKP